MNHLNGHVTAVTTTTGIVGNSEGDMHTGLEVFEGIWIVFVYAAHESSFVMLQLN